jgi:hypothetical protein
MNHIPSSRESNLWRWLRGVLLSWVLPIVAALVMIQLLVYRETSVPGLAPRPVTGLQELTSESDLQVRFAQDAGNTRLLLLISPT